MERSFYVYILASKRNGTLYIGATNDIARRVWEHKNNTSKCFTSDYSVHKLVWYEPHPTWTDARRRERAIKTWLRKWKLDLIEKHNPQWKDLYETLNQ